MFIISLYKVDSVDPSSINTDDTKIIFTDYKDLVVDTNKEDVCRTARRLYERAVDSKKKVTWDEIFLSLISLFSTQDNNQAERVDLIIKAKELCPTYKDAVKLLNVDNLRSTS